MTHLPRFLVPLTVSIKKPYSCSRRESTSTMARPIGPFARRSAASSCLIVTKSPLCVRTSHEAATKKSFKASSDAVGLLLPVASSPPGTSEACASLKDECGPCLLSRRTPSLDSRLRWISIPCLVILPWHAPRRYCEKVGSCKPRTSKEVATAYTGIARRLIGPI